MWTKDNKRMLCEKIELRAKMGDKIWDPSYRLNTLNTEKFKVLKF